MFVICGRVASAGRRFRVWSGGERPVRAVAGAVVHRAMLPDPVRVGVAGASVIGIRRCDRLDTYGIVCRTVWPVACGGLVAGDGRCRHHMDCLVDAIRPTTHITGTCGQGAVCAGDIGGRDCGGGCWGVVLDFFHPLRGSPGLKLSVTFPAVLPSVRFFADSSPRRGSQ